MLPIHIQFKIQGQNTKKQAKTTHTRKLGKYKHAYTKNSGSFKSGLSRRSWFPATTGRPDQVWLPWMVRLAASGPPLGKPAQGG